MFIGRSARQFLPKQLVMPSQTQAIGLVEHVPLKQFQQRFRMFGLLIDRIERASDDLPRRIPLQHPAHKFWPEEEEKLLGTRPDEEVAQLLHRSLSSVKSHRLSIGLPALWRKSGDSR